MIEILYQDKDICVVNKPSGYVVHKTKGSGSFPILLQTLRDQLGAYLYPVHRLDRGTSGAIAFAFSPESARNLQTSLQSPTSIKKYITLCLGSLDSKGTFDRPLNNEKKIKQEAVTHYKTLETIGDYSLLELQLVTGRKHQIRRHLSHEKHHIIGDVNHGKGWLNRMFREKYEFHRLFLHCSELSFTHPFTNENISESPDLPLELKQLLNQLKVKV